MVSRGRYTFWPYWPKLKKRKNLTPATSNKNIKKIKCLGAKLSILEHDWQVAWFGEEAEAALSPTRCSWYHEQGRLHVAADNTNTMDVAAGRLHVVAVKTKKVDKCSRHVTKVNAIHRNF